MSKINESRFIGRLSVLLNISQKKTREYLEVIKQAIIDEIVLGNKVNLKGLCTFEIIERRVRDCNLPNRKNTKDILKRLKLVPSVSFKNKYLRNKK